MKRSLVEDALALRAKVRYEGECWVWTGALKESGYGAVRFGGRTQRAHRVAYLLSGRCIPDGLVLDHLCRNRACIRPSHLEPVTIGENVRRGERNRVTNCPQGHPYSGENLRIGRDGHRECRACGRERERRRRAAR